MDIAIVVLLVVCVATLAALVAVIVAGRIWVRRVEHQLTSTPEVVAGARVVGRGRILTVEILNPLEVAAAQNRFAGIAGSLAPALITKVVYDRAAKLMREELGKFGVEALVEVRSTLPAASSRTLATPKSMNRVDPVLDEMPEDPASTG